MEKKFRVNITLKQAVKQLTFVFCLTYKAIVNNGRYNLKCQGSVVAKNPDLGMGFNPRKCRQN